MNTSTFAKSDQAPGDNQRLFSLNPRLEEFSKFLVPHKVFVECERDILRRVARPGVSNILSVVGPSGAGKTQLLNEVGGALLASPAPSRPDPSADSAAAARPHLPVVYVTANSGRTFESRFKNLLKQILKQVNGVATKLGEVRADSSPTLGRPSHFLDHIPIAQLEELVRSGLRERQVRAVLVDEAQHLAQSADADDWQLVGNGLKLLGSISGTLIVLFGTSEVLSLPSLTSALGRRTKAIHLRRYHWNNSLYPHDVGEFESVVAAFASGWPDVLPVDLLLKNLPYVYTGCVGCVGTFYGWIYDAMALAEQEGLPSVTFEILQRTAHSEAKLRKFHLEAQACETAFAAEHAGFDKLMAELCPSSEHCVFAPLTEVTTAAALPHKKKPKPGNRNPTYDPYPAVAAVQEPSFTSP